MAKTYLSSLQVDERLGEVVLKPHQVEAAARILELLHVHGGAVLADATGMGKTFVAMAVSRAFGRTTIIAPAALKVMWRGSLARSGISAAFVSYESLSRSAVGLGDWPELLVLDEAHHARNPASRRYARIADLAWGAQVLILTATPIHNRGRDLRALLALFVGSRADSMPDDEVRRYIVRRTSESLGSSAMPALQPPIWLEVPRDPATLRAIEAIPPAVPAMDGSPAHALMVLGLIRAWSSSEAALRATLKRRLRRAASFLAALDSGHFPARRDLDSWPVVDDAIQLGLPALFPDAEARVDLGHVQDALVRHQEGVRGVMRMLDRRDAEFDRVRADHLLAIMARHQPLPVVAFSQYADTARGLFQASASRGGVALVTGKGARVASGPVSTDELVRGFDIGAKANAAMPLELLVTTDVLSEGLSLRRAGVIVHLDVPWTLARLEQRVGRLRRLGSPHRYIHVYAIGPPLEAAELTRVLRALQRKARLTTNVVGAGELQATVPLLGDRLQRATARVVQRHEAAATERLRELLGGWIAGRTDSAPVEAHDTLASLALLQKGGTYRLLAVRAEGASDRITDVSDAVVSLGGGPARSHDEFATPAIVATIDAWIEAQRARDMVRPAIDAPSPAHVGVLRALHDALRDTPRTDRRAASMRIEHYRSLVTAARGVGVELAMDQLLRDGFRIEALERLLGSRPTPTPSHDGEWRVVALLESVAGQTGVRAFIAESPRPGPPRSSTLLAAHAGAPG